MMPPTSLLLTDLYQFTMMQAYLDHGMEQEAVFEFFVRRLPAHRNFLLAAGLEQVLDYLSRLSFPAEELEWLEGTKRFSPALLDYLKAARFTGDVDAMPEGTVFFPHEPILRVVAPLPLAQFVETRIMNLLNFQTMIASKAARSVLVAQGRPLIDFGLRRAHGAEAGLLAARASYLAGFAGSATVLAGKEFGIPLYGTMAHSFVQAHQEEIVAFEHFARAQPANVVLLIDTYDTEEAAKRVVLLAPRLKARGIPVQAVRLDSGDLGDHARKVRRILDASGLPDTRILASGNLDEYRIRDLVKTAAPVDSFAVGTAVTTAADAPSLDCAYKLQEYHGRPRRKRSEGKTTWPGRKQVYRQYGKSGLLGRDILTLEQESEDGEPLLQPVMKKGERLGNFPSLDDIRTAAARQLARLPEPLQQLEDAATFPVEISPALRQLADRVDRGIA
ncbi:MAG TPA: nicotinate phosphoribosyltransferase [Nitrospira sp.]|nr:nicotinate phosphoribosyltransferase [Nitrospira sp.]